MSGRLDGLKQIRVRTGAPWYVCARTFDDCGGDIEQAVEQISLGLPRDGDPWHRCTEACPPWRFNWRRLGLDGHACSTHCLRHPDPRHQTVPAIGLLFDLDAETVRRAAAICQGDREWTERFLDGAGAPRA